ncbi:MAG: thioredoxin family protein [Chloroflexi bacterium]|nr:thioredoxin family protein [Chloroflexota bacterium]
MNGLQKAYIGRIKVVRIDREDPENIDIVEQYGARNQPMFFMLDKDGEIIWEWIGSIGSYELEQVFLMALE